MPDASWIQATFLGGEWSPYAQGRVDIPSYRQALNVCRNSMPIEEGAWVRRGGTKHICNTLNSAVARIVKFDFENNNPYQMEFTAGALRFVAVATKTGTSALDWTLATTNDAQAVVGISTANPAVLQTGAAHGWNTGDQVVLLINSQISNAFSSQLTGRVLAITVVDPTHFSLADPVSGAINGAAINWPAVLTGGVTVARILKMTSPYAAADLPLLRHIQAETESILLHNAYQPQALNVATVPTASNFATFSIAPISFVDGPYLDPPTDGSTLTPSATTGAITLSASSASSINNGVGFGAGDVGRAVRLYSTPAQWASGTTYAIGNSVTYNGAFFTAIAGSTGAEPDISQASWQINTNAALWAWAIINSVTDSKHVVATLQTNPVNANLLYTVPITVWQLGVYSTGTGWPSSGCYYEGRLWLTGSIPNRVDASNVNDLFNFSPTSADGTVADNNGISEIFNSDDVNPIYWMIGTGAGIVCGTQPGEWLIAASSVGYPLTPTSIQAHRVTSFGCANIDPQHTELTISFVHRYGRKVLEYFPDVFSGRYTAPNLNHNSKHLTVTGIDEIRYQQELLPVIWARCGDGSLFGLTYKRASLFSSQGPEFIAAHRHDLGSGRTLQSIEVGPSEDGTLDSLFMVTGASSSNYGIEAMTQFYDIGDTLPNAWQLDSAIVPAGGVFTQSASGNSITFYGLWPLNGQQVSVWCGGIDVGADGNTMPVNPTGGISNPFTVTNGQITVPIDVDPAQGLFTTTYLASISSTSNYGNMACPIWNTSGVMFTIPCVVGFTFESDGQLLRPDAPEQNKSATGAGTGKKTRIFQLSSLLVNAQGISFGENFGDLRAARLTTPGGTKILPLNQLFSGVISDLPVQSTYDYDSMMCWRVQRPYPCSVASITAFMQEADK